MNKQTRLPDQRLRFASVTKSLAASLAVSTLLLATFAGNASVCAQPAAKQVKPARKFDGYALTQTCKVTGEADLLVSKGGVKVTYRKTGLVNLFLPPYKEIVCFSPASKTICRAPSRSFSNFVGNSMAMFTFTIEDAQLEPAGTVKKYGFNLRKLKSTAAYERSQAAKRARRELSASAPASLVIVGSVVPDIVNDPVQANFVQRVHCMPPCDVFPLEVQNNSMAKGHIPFLVTSQLKATKIDGDAYNIPANFKTVKNMQTLLETNSSTAAIQMIVP